jgi:hypothetical protein
MSKWGKWVFYYALDGASNCLRQVILEVLSHFVNQFPRPARKNGHPVLSSWFLSRVFVITISSHLNSRLINPRGRIRMLFRLSKGKALRVQLAFLTMTNIPAPFLGGI